VSWQPVALGGLTTRSEVDLPHKVGVAPIRRLAYLLFESMNIHDGEFRPDGLVFLDDAQAEHWIM